MRYDATSAVYRASNRKVLSALAAGGMGWLFGGVQLVHAYLMAPKARVVLALMLIAFVVAFLWGLRFSYQLVRRGPIVAVLPEGLFIRLQRLDGEFIAWSNIARAAANKNMKSVALFIRDAKMVRDLAGVFRTFAEVEQFTAQVNARVSAVPTNER